MIHAGPIKSPVPGRTDHIPMTVGSGSFVIPADIVSALGEGNTDAGHEALMRKFKLSPARRSRGGAVQGVDILAAGGEHVVSPDDVLRIGGGDLEKGHAILDRFVKQERARLVKTLKALPNPVK